MVHADEITKVSEAEKDSEGIEEPGVSEYEPVMYETDDGMMAAEVNAVAQTSDGFIWVGTYSGLYMFDGIKFEYSDMDDRIRNVMTLISDSKGRLWIGTNDNGACCYDPVTKEKTFYSTENGLSADSIREIGEDSEGNIYIGTVLSIAKISPDGKITNYNDWDDISYAISFDCTDDGKVIGVTNGGILFMLKDDKILSRSTFTREEGVYYRYVSFAGDELFVGTSANIIDRYVIDGNSLKYKGTFTVDDLHYFNLMNYDEKKDCIYCCCENGMGCLELKTEKFTNMTKPDFSGAVSDCCIDMQGNVWFASNKHGLVKYSTTPFENLYRIAGISENVVNAVMKDDKELYIGTDNGLIVLNLKTYKVIEKSYQKLLDGVRIRHIFEDSKGNKWFSTYGEDGLICINKNDRQVELSGDISKEVSGRCRSAIELKDGRVLVACNNGLTFIKDGQINARIRQEDGLNNQYILSMIEREDGSILAGSDGDGIYIIKDDEIVGHIGKEEGLNTAVILRIVKCSDGYLYVTSNAIYHDDGKTIKRLDKFPYSNNYDIKITDDGICWIMSSAGLFIVPEDQLLKDEEYTYALLNENWGLTTSFTANSWNDQDGDELYLCCTEGVRKISTENYDMAGSDFNLQLKSIDLQGEATQDTSGRWHIPAVNGRIQFNIAVNNYTLSNPLISYYLENSTGQVDEGITCYQNEITPLIFTNLPYGDYKLHIIVVNEETGKPEKETVVEITKDAMMYERLRFKIYLCFVGVLFIMYIGWLFYSINKRTSSIRGLQKEMITDPMTGILNKAGSERTLKAVCAEETGILLMIDLDSFKLVNDIYGHDMGDRILIRFAELLKKATTEEDVVGRLGGDEFVGFIKNSMDESDVENFTKFMNREIVKSAKEYMGEDMNIPLGTSVGAVRVPVEGRDFDELFRLADKALYVVKQNGKHGYAFYQKSSETKDLDSDNKDKNNLNQIKKIIGERNEGKGAFLINFDKLQVIYKFINRNDRAKNTTTGFFRFTITSRKSTKVTDEIRESFEEYLVTNLRKNDVISVYSGSIFLLCVGKKHDDYSDVADRLIEGWTKEHGEEFIITYEAEDVGE